MVSAARNPSEKHLGPIRRMKDLFYHRVTETQEPSFFFSVTL
jgi:hypothetical protein